MVKSLNIYTPRIEEYFQKWLNEDKEYNDSGMLPGKI